MDAENRVDGEEGKPGAPEGEAPPASQEGTAAPSAPAEAQAGSGEPSAPAGDVQAEGTAPAAEARTEELPARAAAAVATEVQRLNNTTVRHLPLEEITDDATFRIRPEGDISALATDVARLGQLFPVDVRHAGPYRYQVICGFRRVAALRFLKRDRVLVRIHEGLSDEDALLLALASAIHAAPVEREALEAKKAQLESEGRLSAPIRDMLEKALETEDGLAPEGVEEEVDADELSDDVTQRLGEINQDLSLLAEAFSSLDETRKAELLNQLRYSADLVAYLEGL